MKGESLADADRLAHIEASCGRMELPAGGWSSRVWCMWHIYSVLTDSVRGKLFVLPGCVTKVQ